VAQTLQLLLADVVPLMQQLTEYATHTSQNWVTTK
jgi:hypothetical protein